MRHFLLSSACAIAAAVGGAQANTLFTADFSGSGSVTSRDGSETEYSFENDGGPIDETRLVNTRSGMEGGIHVRAFGDFLDDDTYNFVNSAMAQGNSSAMAETVISLEFTNTGTVRQQITLTSTIIPGALGVYFAENCRFQNEGGDDLFSCPEAATEARLLSDTGNFAETLLDIAVYANGEQTDSFNLGLQSTGNGSGGEPNILTDFDDASKLNGFGRLNPGTEILDSVFYKWDESIVEFFGGIVDPGETVSIEVVFQSMVSIMDDQGACDICLSTFMGFGDPIGGGSDDDEEGTFMFNRFQSSFNAEIQIEGTFEDPSAVPIPGAVWLMGAGVAGLAARARRKNRQ